MKRMVLFSLLLLIFAGFNLDAQKMVVKSGSLDFLKGQKSILVKYDYSNMAVGKYDTEAEYVDLKVKEGNDAEPGKGDKWRVDWFGKRTTAYEPSFEELFNKGLEKNGFKGSQTVTDATYCMTIHTMFTDVGYYIGVSSRPAYINAEITYTNISTGEVMAVMTADKVPGIGGIKESYAKLGKSLAPVIAKKL